MMLGMLRQMGKGMPDEIMRDMFARVGFAMLQIYAGRDVGEAMSIEALTDETMDTMIERLISMRMAGTFDELQAGPSPLELVQPVYEPGDPFEAADMYEDDLEEDEPVLAEVIEVAEAFNPSMLGNPSAMAPLFQSCEGCNDPSKCFAVEFVNTGDCLHEYADAATTE